MKIKSLLESFKKGEMCIETVELKILGIQRKKLLDFSEHIKKEIDINFDEEFMLGEFLDNYEEPEETITTDRFLLGIRKYGFDSEFRKGYQSISSCLNFHELDEYCDKWEVPKSGIR